MNENDYVDGDEQQRHDRYRTSRRHVLERDHRFPSARRRSLPVLIRSAVFAASTNCLTEYAAPERWPLRRKLSISASVPILPRAPEAVQFRAAAALLNSSIASIGHS